MYQTTDAIVITSIKYGETSRVVHCYTRNFGLQGYLINGVSSAKSAFKPSLLLPLTQLQLVATQKGRGTLERIKEAKLIRSYQTIPTQPVRNALALFVAEVLHKTLREENPNPEKFDFVLGICNQLEDEHNLPPHFPSSFLLELSRFLGFYPHNIAATPGSFFDFMEGVFVPVQPQHPHYATAEISAAMANLLHAKADLSLSKSVRRQLLYDLLSFYRIHHDGFGRLKSVEVLEEVFG